MNKVSDNNVVLSTSPFADCWLMSIRTNGGMRRIEPTEIPKTVKAGDAARHVAENMPDYQIGVETTHFGPATVQAVLLATGDYVLWMNKGFEKRERTA